MSICYVTAFLDIGRDDWKSEEFGRKYDEYEKAFLRFLDFFIKNNMDSYLIIFLDKKKKDNIEKEIKNFDFIKLVLIDTDYLEINSPLWKRIGLEKEIMDSIEFRNKIIGREKCPETKFPKYTLINHAKIDFIYIAMKKMNIDYYCWFDYGYFSNEKFLPNNLLDINLLDIERINYTTIQDIYNIDYNIDYTLKFAPDKLCGYFFFGRKDKLLEYRELYHKIHKEFQDLWIVDDDQHIVLRCYERNPNLFYLHNLGEWHKAFIHFQKR